MRRFKSDKIQTADGDWLWKNTVFNLVLWFEKTIIFIVCLDDSLKKKKQLINDTHILCTRIEQYFVWCLIKLYRFKIN